ncbi:MAG: hypothetical protein L7S56_06705 [Candidatus Poseidonia sp.]|nr:hypothetical protein [Poseidonia sp.]
MGWTGVVGMFVLGALIGHIGPRIPTLMMSRAKGFNTRFAPHPDPITLSPYLTQRVLHLRTFYWLSLAIAIIPLVFGAISLRWGSASFGFGLWVAASWTVLSRLQNLVGERGAPWTLDLARTLQKVMNEADSHTACCTMPVPVWDLQAINCTSCGAVLVPLARPDLGRSRSDGRFKGTLRLLITDGYPMLPALTVDATSEE